MKVSPRQNMHQNQSLSLQLSHAIRLMGLSALELQALIEETLSENPFLEWEMAETSPHLHTQSNDRFVYNDVDTWITLVNPVSLRDKLIFQCELTSFSLPEKEIALTLIDAIDDNGYLSTPLEQLFP